MSTDELRLRRLLWLHHGHGVACLYGDDGEMQCHRCILDFKRAPIVDLEWALDVLHQLRAAPTLAVD